MKPILLWLLVFVSVEAFSQATETYEGQIDGMDENFRFIVIDDGTFPLALNAKVKDEKGREVNRYALKPGMKVRYEYSLGANGYNQLSSITILK